MERLLLRRKQRKAAIHASQETPSRHYLDLSECPPVSFFPDGVKVLHDCSDAAADICFVHGLTGDRDSTWTADGQFTPWPKTFLPRRLHKARILSYGYDAYILRKSVASSNRLIDHATNLLNDLTTERASCNASFRPLIFIAHSLGGLVCKKTILLSRHNPESHLRDVFYSIKGIVFMGTPHKGAWMAEWARIPASALGLMKSTNIMLLDILQRDNQLLESIQIDFLAMVRELREGGRSFDVTCFFEELPFPVIGKVVSKQSATLEGYTLLSVHANHRDMVRFASVEDNGFRRLLGELNRWVSHLVLSPSGIVAQKVDRHLLNAEDRACLRDLQTTNPRDDKDRIEKVKGGLLKDSYHWILDHDNFKQWRDNQDSKLLWIEGDPGKGKTMLLCGIIDELTKSAPDTVAISFFFCQATDVRINNATAVLRGLIYLLVDKKPSLISHVRQRYDEAGKQLFEDVNAWQALSKIFTGILEDPILQCTYLIIDALDECTTGLPFLLDLIARKSSAYPHVRWIVSSRNWPSIEEGLNPATQKVRLCLELNETSVSEAVSMYIQHKVHQLVELKKYSDELHDTVCRRLMLNAEGTFLWVALVCQELAKTSRWNVLQKLGAFPPGLDALYMRMLEQIGSLDDAGLCRRILSVVSTVYRPIKLDELTSFVDIPDNVSEDSEFLTEIIGLCGSFLTLRECTISFVHQSAKEFLVEKASDKIFASGIKGEHHSIFSRSLQVLFRTLQRDVYSLMAPGLPIYQVKQPYPDSLAAARYSCVYWVNHLHDCDSGRHIKDDLQDGGLVDRFLSQKYLHWLEALSLLRSIPEGIMSILKLERLLQGTKNATSLANLAQDASRFIRYHKWAIEQHPLQVYSSALIFSPSRSVIRKQFKLYEPGWVVVKPAIEDDWSTCLQTLEGHSDIVWSVVWSHDGTRLATASSDKTVKIWHPATGQCIATLNGHSDQVTSITWSHDGTRLASASSDKTAKIWDPASGQCIATLNGHSDQVTSITWSHDGTRLASASSDKTAKIWDLATGQCISTLNGHSDWVTSITWSCDGKWLASASYDKTIRIWDPAIGRCKLIIEDHHSSVMSVDWSHNATLLASASEDKTVRIWDPITGQCISALKEHTDKVWHVAWSPSGERLASASSDNTIKIWDPATGQSISTLVGHSGWLNFIAWSHDGTRLASASSDRTVKVWDPITGQCKSTFEGHSDHVRSVAWLYNGKQLASSSYDGTVKIWDPALSQHISTLQGHRDQVSFIAWSHDGTQFASASFDKTVKIWDVATGRCIMTLEGHSNGVWSIAWSNDGKNLVSASSDKTVKVWNQGTGECISTLEGHNHRVTSAKWSHDGLQLASASSDKTVKIWDVATGQCIVTLEGHSDLVWSVAWSHDGENIASTSSDNTIKVWNRRTGECVSTLKGHGNAVRSVAWSLDKTRLGSASYDRTLKIWDQATGQCLSTLDIGQFPGELRFDESSSNILHTGVGTFNSQHNTPHATLSTTVPDCEASLPQRVGYGLRNNSTWVTLGDENLLWLPPEYRPQSPASSGIFRTTIAIGCSSGRVLVLKFSKDQSISS